MIFFINIPIYRCSIVALVEATKQDWQEFYSLRKDEITEKDYVRVCDEFDGDYPGFVVATEGNDYVVYVESRNKIGLVTHELLHASYNILFDRGHTHGQNSEALAYLLEYIINEFYTIVEKEESK